MSVVSPASISSSGESFFLSHPSFHLFSCFIGSANTPSSSSVVPPTRSSSIADLASGHFQINKCLFEVGRRLGWEEFLLLKTLYIETLCLRILSCVNTLQEVYQHSIENRIGVTRRDGLIKENMRLSRQELLALLAYRLQILIPTSEVLTKKDTRNMGAKDAISSLQNLLGTLPTVEEIEISKESRLVECLVKCYVNMTSKQRNVLKQCFAACLGLNADTATIFEMFADQFMRPPEEVVMMFTSSMRQAQCHRSAYIELQENLQKHSIPHEEIHIPGVFIA